MIASRTARDEIVLNGSQLLTSSRHFKTETLQNGIKCEECSSRSRLMVIEMFIGAPFPLALNKKVFTGWTQARLGLLAKFSER